MRIDLFGHLVVDINENRCVIAQKSRDGRHLTFHFRPQPSGRYAGLLTPHTTIGRVRRTLMRLRPDRLHRLGDRIGEDLAASFRAKTRPVNPTELDTEGWAVIYPLDDEENKALFDSLRSDQNPRAELRLDEAAMEEFGRTFLERLVSPLALDDPEFPCGEQVWAMRANDRGEPETLVLVFRADSQRDSPGWYATPVPFVSPDYFERLVGEYCGPTGLKMLKQVDRFFNG